MGGFRAKGKKKQKANLFVRIFRIRAWKLILIAIILAFVSATLLRFDHIKMTELRDAVLASDKAADDEQLVEDMQNLREFVATHIVFNVLDKNGAQEIVFGTGPFYLEESYTRKAEAEIKKAQEAADKQGAATNPNGNIYSKVSDICDALGRRYGWRYPDQRYINCWTSELAKFPSSGSIDIFETAEIPSTDLYRYDYSSPIWYPCASGFVILACVILLVWALTRIVIWFIAKIALFVISRIDR